jgi:hypothetical protein
MLAIFNPPFDCGFLPAHILLLYIIRPVEGETPRVCLALTSSSFFFMERRTSEIRGRDTEVASQLVHRLQRLLNPLAVIVIPELGNAWIHTRRHKHHPWSRRMIPLLTF